jgi:hypothetical protein
VNTTIQLALHMEAEAGRAVTGPLQLYNAFLSRDAGASPAEQICLAPNLLDSASADWRSEWAGLPIGEYVAPAASSTGELNTPNRPMTEWVQVRLNVEYGDPGDLLSKDNSPIFTRFWPGGTLPDWLRPAQTETVHCRSAAIPCAPVTTTRRDEILFTLSGEESERLRLDRPDRAVEVVPERGPAEEAYCHFCGWHIDKALAKTPVEAKKKLSIPSPTVGLLVQPRLPAMEAHDLDLTKTIRIENDEYIVKGAAVCLGRHWWALCKEGERWWKYDDDKPVTPFDPAVGVRARYLYIQKSNLPPVEEVIGVEEEIVADVVGGGIGIQAPGSAVAHTVAAHGPAVHISTAAVVPVSGAVDGLGAEIVRSQEEGGNGSMSPGVGGPNGPGLTTGFSVAAQAEEFDYASDTTGDDGDACRNHGEAGAADHVP